MKKGEGEGMRERGSFPVRTKSSKVVMIFFLLVYLGMVLLIIINSIEILLGIGLGYFLFFFLFFYPLNKISWIFTVCWASFVFKSWSSNYKEKLNDNIYDEFFAKKKNQCFLVWFCLEEKNTIKGKKVSKCKKKISYNFN